MSDLEADSEPGDEEDYSGGEDEDHSVGEDEDYSDDYDSDISIDGQMLLLDADHFIQDLLDGEARPELPRENFDNNVPMTEVHSYLFGEGEQLVQVSTSGELSVDARQSFPLVKLNAVILPGQVVPLIVSGLGNHALLKAVAEHNYIVVMPALVDDVEDDTEDYGVVAEIVKYTQNDDSSKAIIRAHERFLLEERQLCNSSDADVGILMAIGRILETEDCTNMREMLPNSMLKFSNKMAKPFCTALDGRPIALNPVTIICEELVQWCQKYHSEEKIQIMLKKDIAHFCYWVASQFPLSLHKKYALLRESDLHKLLLDVLDLTRTVTKFTCQCGTTIATSADLLCMHRDSTTCYLMNMSGYLHECTTFGTCQNLASRGFPDARFSWFKGYSWQMLNCTYCGGCYGWKFTSSTFLPAEFYGIAAHSLVLST